MSEAKAGEMSLGLEVSKGLVAKVIHAAIGFVGTLIFARVLGPTNFGGYYLILTVAAIVKRPIDGVTSATQKRYAESDSPRQEIFGAQLGLNILYLIIAGVGVFVFQANLEAYTGVATAAPLLLVLLVVRINYTTFQPFLSSIGRLGTQMWINTLQSVFVFTFQLLFVIFLFSSGVVGMVFGMTVGEALLIPLTHYYLRTKPHIPSIKTIRSIGAFARYSIPSSFLGKAYDRFDILLLGFLAAPAAAGYYEVAYKLTLPAIFVSGLASRGLMVKVSDLHSRGGTYSREISNVLSFSSVIAIPLFFGALAMADSIVVTAYGPAYRTAGTLLIGLSLYRVLHTQATVLESVTHGMDQPRFQMWASLIALIINIVLGIALFEVYQALGVVIATVIAEIVRYIVLLLAVLELTDANLFPDMIFRQFVSGALMFGAIELLLMRYAVHSWIDLVIFLGIGAVLYFSVLTIISKHFRVTIRSVVSQVKR